MLAAARAFGLQAIVLECRRGGDFAATFATIVEHRAGAFIVVVSFRFSMQLRIRDRIVELAAQHKLPGIYPHRMYVTAGGMMSYDAHEAVYREIGLTMPPGAFVKGASPSRPACPAGGKFNLAINQNRKSTRPNGTSDVAGGRETKAIDKRQSCCDCLWPVMALLSHGPTSALRPLLRVIRTSSRHRPNRPSLTHCGSRAAKLAVIHNSSSSYVLGWRYEAARFHHSARRHRSRVAASGKRAAAGDAGDRFPQRRIV